MYMEILCQNRCGSRKDAGKTTKKVSRQVRNNQKRALRVSAGYVVFLTVAALLALVVCVGYVRLQAKITDTSKNLTVMQEELADLREENDTRYNAVMDSGQCGRDQGEGPRKNWGWSMPRRIRWWNMRALLQIM